MRRKSTAALLSAATKLPRSNFPAGAAKTRFKKQGQKQKQQKHTQQQQQHKKQKQKHKPR